MPTPRTLTGALSTTSKILYRVPAGKYAIIVNLSMCCTGGTARNVDVTVQTPSDSAARTVVSRQLAVAHSAGADFSISEERWILVAGTSVSAVQAVGTDVEWMVCALEYDA